MRTFLAALALMIGAGLHAQLPTVDVTLAANANNELEVKVRPDLAFDGLFSSIVFTIRWETASGATLDNPVQVMPAASYIPLSLSGAVMTDGAYSYATYAGFGFSPLSNLGTSWAAGTEYTLVTIPVQNGTALFEIADDTFTGSMNGSYFVSLNGTDRTGVIYSSSTGVPAGSPVAEVSVSPNPTTGAVELRWDGNEEATVEVFNAAGQLLATERFAGANDGRRALLDLSPNGPGMYTLRVRMGDKLRTERVVVR
ncbi:MAG: T9SS type A sorting domain-containing protein [Flavobacteriales bacterium]|nr:T9SS type A sorting domain-containing protein [Flavobacteriales bacterium]